MTDRAKKILRNVLFLLSVPMIIGAYLYAQKTTKQELCKGVNITIENPEINFVTKEDIVNIIENEGIKPNVILVKDINCKLLESKIESNKWVSSSELFISPNNFINVKVEQRKPVIRIQQKDSSDYAYYLDSLANPISLSTKYTPLVSVATTNRLAYTEKDLKLKSSLVKLAQFIDKDTFWNADISQIDINDDNQITLVPMIGTQTIILGNTEDLENKMARLFTFYQQGMSTVKWSLYDEIDLRYKGQIVCRNTRGEILAEDPYSKDIPKAKATVEKSSIAPTHSVSAKVDAPKEKVVAPKQEQPKSKVEKPKTDIKKTTPKKVPIVTKKPEVKQDSKPIPSKH